MEQTRFIYGRLPYELGVIELDPAETVSVRRLRVAPFRSTTQQQAYGYAIVEEPRPGTSTPTSPSGSASSPALTSGACSAARAVGGVAPSR